jgi:hypothetical protein
VIDHAAVMNSCSDKLDKVGPSGVSPVERTIALASRANFELELGGFSSFFHNSTREHADETAIALVALGAMREAAAMRRGIKLLKSLTWSQAIERGDFADLDQFIHEEPRDIFDRLCEFIESHATELEGP